MVRNLFFLGALLTFSTVGLLALVWPSALWSLVVFVPILVVGVYDVFQTQHAVLRNFPIIGHARYLLESIRPEIQQYFIEPHTVGSPFSREERSIVYQRAKRELDTVPFGTQHNVYEPGFEWVNHSLNAHHGAPTPPRVMVGGADCKQRYAASMLNISAMSFGSLSPTAIKSLNRGARIGEFAHNTGEGGISPYHREGGDLVWQIGTGYFGCRTLAGEFNPDMFAENAGMDAVKMVEIKLSQGAKPGHGGILPGAKVNAEIAKIRGVEIGKDVLSPPTHRAFSNPIELCEFIAELRSLSGGKPVGFKLCVGRPSEFLAICKGMIESGIRPDFITVDGKEGGTGAAPLEFSNAVGMPLREGLRFVHNALVAANLRGDIKLIASGKVISGFDIMRAMVLGADLCNSARGMMLALGCIQALRCNSNVCPTGVATQDKSLYTGINVPDKAERVARFHRATVRSFLDLTAAAGIDDPHDIHPSYVMRRVDEVTIRTYEDLYPTVDPGILITGDAPLWLAKEWDRATHLRF